jgi:hypothetical protein
VTDCRGREYEVEQDLSLKGGKKETKNEGELNNEVLHHLLCLPHSIGVLNPTGRNDNVIMDIKANALEGVDWIILAHHRQNWWT